MRTPHYVRSLPGDLKTRNKSIYLPGYQIFSVRLLWNLFSLQHGKVEMCCKQNEPLLAKQQVDGWTCTFDRSKQLKPEARKHTSSYLSSFRALLPPSITQKQQTHSDSIPQRSGPTTKSHAPPSVNRRNYALVSRISE